jgi:hypothetical protein
MRQCTVVVVVLASLLAAAIPAREAVATRRPDNRNAATWYNRAFEHLGRVSEADWEAVWSYLDDPSGGPSPRVRDMLARAAPMIDLARRGAQQGYSDYALDYDQGFALTLPHLAQIRNITRIMEVDVMVRLHDGDSAGAADRVSAMYRMAGHCGDDGVLISSLVGNAVFKLAERAADRGFDTAQFTPLDAATILRGVDGLAGTDPFDAVEGVVGEQAIGVDWLAQMYGRQEDRAHLVETLGWLEEDDPDAQALMAMSDEEFAAEVDAYDKILDRTIAAFAATDPAVGRAELEAIERELEAGEHGALLHMLMPAFTRVFDNIADSEAKIAERRVMLTGLARGVIEPDEKANAARYYARAIEMLWALEPARLDVVRAYARRSDATAPDAERDALLETLSRAAEIVDHVRAGSEKERCDFSVLRSRRRYPLCPDYVAGMWDLFLLVFADAKRLAASDAAAADDPAAAGLDAAVDRLAVMHRMVAHLSGDDLMLGARVAHEGFALVDRFTEDAIASQRLTDAHRATLLVAARKMGRKDPFGYVQAVVHTRERVAGLIYTALMGAEYDAELRSSLESAVQTWNGDQLLFYLAVRDTMARGEGPDRTLGLTGVIDLDALRAVRDGVPAVAPHLARGEIEVFTDPGAPEWAAFVEHSRAARGDLRHALGRLRPDDSPPAPEAE